MLLLPAVPLAGGGLEGLPPNFLFTQEYPFPLGYTSLLGLIYFSSFSFFKKLYLLNESWQMSCYLMVLNSSEQELGCFLFIYR